MTTLQIQSIRNFCEVCKPAEKIKGNNREPRVRLSRLVANRNVPELEKIVRPYVTEVCVQRRGGYSGRVSFVSVPLANHIRVTLERI